MDKTHADAVVQAILTPDLEAREALQKKRAEEARLLARQRQVAWLALVGFAIGASVAHFVVGTSFASGGVWGGMVGAAVGWLRIGFRSRRHSA